MESYQEGAQSRAVSWRKATITPWRVVALVLGTIFFSLIAAIHAVSATGATSIHWLAMLWIVVPAPAVFLWLMLAHRMKKELPSIGV